MIVLRKRKRRKRRNSKRRMRCVAKLKRHTIFFIVVINIITIIDFMWKRACFTLMRHS